MTTMFGIFDARSRKDNDNIKEGNAPPPSPQQEEHQVKIQGDSNLSNVQESPEVLGWTLDAAARGSAIGGAIFVSTALLKLCKEAAGCDTTNYNQREDNDVVQECEGRIYGMRPSSLLTNIVTIVGLVCALLMPLVGAIIDHTRYRRHVGRISAAVFTLLIMAQLIFLLEHVWLGAAIAQVVVAITYSIHLVATYAYLPELTDDADTLVAYSARFTAAQYGSSVVFLIIMVGAMTLFQSEDDEDDNQDRDQELASAQLSQSMVFVVCTLFFGIAWSMCFLDRPALHHVPPGKSLFLIGFVKLFYTFRSIVNQHNAVKWFLLSTSLTQATMTAFSSIAITYMTVQMQLTSWENGFVILLLLLSGVPGTKIASFFMRRINPIRSLQLCLLVWVVAIGSAAAALRGPRDRHWTYMFAIIWGVCFGWTAPSEKVLYCTIIPKGQEAELMGVYICACQILGWLPPLVFTLMNEAGISMRIGLLSLTGYISMSFCVLFLIGDYEKAKEHATLGAQSMDAIYELATDVI